MPRLAAASYTVLRNAAIFRRTMTTLPSNPHIKVLDNPSLPASYVLTFLDKEPPSHRLAIGTCTTLPPTPQSFRENPRFLDILNDVVSKHGHEDEEVVRQARALVNPAGSILGSGGAFGSRQRSEKGTSRRQGASGSGTGGTSAQGDAGGGGMGGWVHLSDGRNPPEFGRTAWPEDILGSVQVDPAGQVVGRVQPSGTYRLVTNEGILGLSPFLREKLVERLRKEEAEEQA